MGKDLIIARHAIENLNRFMQRMIQDGRMTHDDQDQVWHAGEEPFALREAPDKTPQQRLQEMTDQMIAGTYRKPDEGRAVETVRKALTAKKAALLGLHPELAADLEAGLASRITLPPPVLGPRFEKPWKAVFDYDNLMQFIEEKIKNAQLSLEDAHAVREPARMLLRQDGFDDTCLSDRDDKSVIAQAFCLAKKKLQDLHPEFAEELRAVGANVGKVMPRGLG